MQSMPKQWVIDIQIGYTGLNGVKGLGRLVSSLAVISHTRYNDPFVDVALSACLVTTLGL